MIKSQTQPDHENQKAVASILSHLEGLRHNRPSLVMSTGKPQKTRETIQKIIAATTVVFTEYGHSDLTLRKVADEAGMAVGNLTYHFPTKQSLLNAMLWEYLADYVEEHLQQFEAERDAPLDILLNVVEFYVVNARKSHRYFFQMWGYAGADAQAKETVRNLYRPIGRFVYYLVRSANPKLNDAQIRQRTLQIFALEEGYKLFIGMGPDDDKALKTSEADIRVLTERIVCGD